MIDLKELYWAAGFIEGEGSFAAAGKNLNVPVIQAAQVNPEPLYRMKGIFGGSVNGPYRNKNPKSSPYFRWIAGSQLGASVMMTLWPLLSERRREQITQVLVIWRGAAIDNKQKTHCINGHEYSKVNTYSINGRWRDCRACAEVRRAKWRAKQKPVEILESIQTDVSN